MMKKIILFGLAQLLTIGVLSKSIEDEKKDAQISFIKLNSTVDDVVWCGNDRVQDNDDETIILEGVESRITNIMFMTSTTGEVFVTNNHGQRWSNFTSSLEKQYPTQFKNKIYIKSIQVSPADTQTVFLFGSNGYSFIARKCGKQVQMIQHDKEFEEFKLNHNDKNYLLAHKSKACKKFDDECEVEERTLHVSKDMGKTFQKIVDNVFLGTWDKSLVQQDEEQNNRILVHYRVKVQGKNNDKKLFTYSDNFFQSSTQIDTQVEHFYQSYHYLFVLTQSDVPDSYNLRVSPKHGDINEQYKTQDINLPMKRIKDHSFTILDTIFGQVFLGINHQGHSSTITNIYYSDVSGQNYTLGLLNAVRNEEGNVDFEKIDSNKGTFIANMYDSKELDRILNQQKKQKDTQGKGSQKRDITSTAQTGSIQSIRKTVISYNYGRTWHPLKAPLKDISGKDLLCSGECSLHFKGRTDSEGKSILSSENAHGIILATGNTGVYLEEKEQNLSTFLSNDGGHTWRQIRDHPHKFAIGDRGGLIVIGKSNSVTDKIHYSWDQGKTWKAMKIYGSPIDILEIVTEHSNMGQKFLIFGKKRSLKLSKVQGIVVSIDFSSLHQRSCEGQWDPEQPDSDYEFWMPKNFNMDTCVFGEKSKYIRRKQNAQCFNPEETDKYEFVEKCQCSQEDFECAFGYYREVDEDGNSQKCIPMNQKYAVNTENYPVPTPCKDVYYIPTGYQRIPITKCSGGLDLGPIKNQCPAQQPKQSSNSQFIDNNNNNNNQNIKNNNSNSQQNINNNSQQNINNNGNQENDGIISKYGLIIVLLIVLYLLREQIVPYTQVVVSFSLDLKDKVLSQFQANSNKYETIGDNESQNLEKMGMISSHNEDYENDYDENQL